MALRSDGLETSSEAEMASFGKAAAACSSPTFCYMWWRESLCKSGQSYDFTLLEGQVAIMI